MKATLSIKLKQLLIFACLIALSLFLSGLVENRLFSFLPLGCILVILSNWIMFKQEGLSLNYLGIDKSHKPINKILIGFLLGLCFVFLNLCIQIVVKGGNFQINHSPDIKALLIALIVVFPTVIVQQFYILGYGFYKAKQIGGNTFAVFVTSIVFISMHDISGNMWNLPFQLSNYFFAILMFSTALNRSGSILLPIGLHWGNNFANSYLITQNEMKTSYIFLAHQNDFIKDYYQYFGLLILGIAVPLIFITAVRILFKDKSEYMMY
ncbi:CAAX prenyl protease-like protein [Flavobacterium sp. 270]|uniref:CPBP family intramembrane glutamic endopeptidase n=1 Tax=Flavobacterium sp. 270 TaxID=2512114 RepID=UPI0010666F33|nr:CPBP family intramembrane glutamic endopeptidase [Flavobacterium sp. 270]TDW51608.1 CAAX prenyl protease-like protein [Flavobacterium sp. 270]